MDRKNEQRRLALNYDRIEILYTHQATHHHHLSTFGHADNGPAVCRYGKEGSRKVPMNVTSRFLDRMKSKSTGRKRGWVDETRFICVVCRRDISTGKWRFMPSNKTPVLSLCENHSTNERLPGVSYVPILFPEWAAREFGAQRFE